VTKKVDARRGHDNARENKNLRRLTGSERQRETVDDEGFVANAPRAVFTKARAQAAYFARVSRREMRRG
jgi:hypothetical protein